MWQRIQTIYLLLAAAGNFVTLIPALAFSYITTIPMGSTVLYDGKLNVYDHSAMLWLVGFAGAASLAAIFMYKKRSRQTMLTWVAALLALALLALAGWMMYRHHLVLNGAAWAGPIAAVLFNMLAVRGISKDEKTVRSMDRLR